MDPESHFLKLPNERKSIGKYNHLRIYKNIQKHLHRFDKLNAFLGNIFPVSFKQFRRYVFYEVRLGPRIPDCVFLFTDKDRIQVHCYLVELKTTFSRTTFNTVSLNKTQNAQYLQGLKQLHESIVYLDKFQGSSDKSVFIYPHILFYRQKNLSLDLAKGFRSVSKKLSFAFLYDLLKKNQDERLQTFLSLPGNANIRESRKERADMSSEGCISTKRARYKQDKGETKRRKTGKVVKAPVAARDKAPKRKVRRKVRGN
ncbi:fusion protein [Suid betaherpesvirus 2]|uniref:Fusion protein n=1 Tax=Suid betaherpesvirus 2 TaxID=1608255 RepID=U3GPK7_9BETA|nr:fusion protein [Suid betaherpesvirus 2]AGT99241.1 fusion protein [Suid betaherpesvirus 2]